MGVDMDLPTGPKGPAAVAGKFSCFSDIEVLLSLSCFIPLLNAVHSLIKLTQSRDVFICDFLQAITICQNELAQMFIDHATTFKMVEFALYKDLLNLSSAEIPL